MDGGWTPVFHAIADVDAWTIYLIGDLDEDGVVDLERALEQVAAVEPRRITLDLSDVTSIGPAGAAGLVAAEQGPIPVALRGLPPERARVLDLAALELAV